MNWSTIILAVAAGLSELLYKALSGQLNTPDDIAQGLARTAVDAGIKAEDLARSVTDEGARRTEEAVALGKSEEYGP